MEPVGTGTAFHSADIGLVVKNERSKKYAEKKYMENSYENEKKNEYPYASSSL